MSNLVTKTDFDNTASSLDSKISTNNSKTKSIENEFKKSKRNLVFVILENIFVDGVNGSQAYLIFQPVHRYVKIIANTNTFLNGNLKDSLMKVLNLLLHLIAVLLH